MRMVRTRTNITRSPPTRWLDIEKDITYSRATDTSHYNGQLGSPRSSYQCHNWRNQPTLYRRLFIRLASPLSLCCADIGFWDVVLCVMRVRTDVSAHLWGQKIEFGERCDMRQEGNVAQLDKLNTCRPGPDLRFRPTWLNL